jgi:hypothetical protein
MARTKGIIDFEGRIGDIVFYKRNGKPVARRAGGPTKEMIANSPAFARTRQNNTEFGGCSGISRSIRASLSELKGFHDGEFGNRLTKQFKIITSAQEGPLGQRPIVLSSNHSAFDNFEGHEDTAFSTICEIPCKTDHDKSRTSATLRLNKARISAINAPKGATHFQLIHALGIVSDFEFDQVKLVHGPVDSKLNGLGVAEYSDYIPLKAKTTPAIKLTAQLPVQALPSEKINVVQAVAILFIQQIGNKIHYPLKQSRAMKIIEVF